jgi:hypothetical protein
MGKKNLALISIFPKQNPRYHPALFHNLVSRAIAPLGQGLRNFGLLSKFAGNKVLNLPPDRHPSNRESFYLS